MSNGAGLLKCGADYFGNGYFINPNYITKIEPRTGHVGCLVTMKDTDAYNTTESLVEEGFDCSSDKFADAMTKAQNTGEIVDIYA